MTLLRQPPATFKLIPYRHQPPTLSRNEVFCPCSDFVSVPPLPQGISSYTCSAFAPLSIPQYHTKDNSQGWQNPVLLGFIIFFKIYYKYI